MTTGDSDKHCSNSWIYIVLYVASIITVQLALNTLMKYKMTRQARWTFSLMVPLTTFAFFFGWLSFESGSIHIIATKTFLDYIAIILATIGVILYNCADEPPSEVLIEKF